MACTSECSIPGCGRKRCGVLEICHAHEMRRKRHGELFPEVPIIPLRYSSLLSLLGWGLREISEQMKKEHPQAFFHTLISTAEIEQQRRARRRARMRYLAQHKRQLDKRQLGLGPNTDQGPAPVW